MSDEQVTLALHEQREAADIQPVEQPQMSTQRNRPAGATNRPTRRLKPEIAAKWAAHRREAEIQNLYETPVEKLSPEEIARMKAAFLRG